MRAGHLDVEIVTGAAWRRDVRLYVPGDVIEAQMLQPGDVMFVRRAPLPVADIDTNGAHTVIHFGHGLHSDPTMSIPSTSLVQLAAPAVATDAVAAFHVDDTTTIDIPATVDPTGVVTLSFDSDETAALVDSVGAWSWDLFVRTSGDWARVLEGTLSIVEGDAR